MNGYQFRITIRRDQAECRYRLGASEKQCDAVPIRREHLETIHVLESWLKRWEWIAKADDRGRLLVPETFSVLGELLWRLAFEGDIGNKLLGKHREVGSDEEAAPIRVRLGFHESAADLAALPWEFLRVPETQATKGFFLAREGNLVLERFVEGADDIGIRQADEAVRMLFVVALPSTDDFREERQEIEVLKAVLGNIRALQIKHVDSWNPQTVTDRLKEFKDSGHEVDVVHLVGVCQDFGGRPKLLLPREQGGAELTDPEPVVEALTSDRRNQPTLVVLHLSDWDKDSSEHFEQLAPSFVRAGIPAVLAMQYPMPPEKGRQFVKSIYDKLALGERIGDAVQTARQGLSGFQRNRQFGAPVLYLQSDVDGALLTTLPDEPDDDLDDDSDANVDLDAAPPSSPPSWSASPLSPSLAVREAPSGLARQNIGFALLRVLDDVPQTDRTSQMRNWVADQLWPDDLGTVTLMLKHAHRQNMDDPAARRLVERLLMYVDDQRLGARG